MNVMKRMTTASGFIVMIAIILVSCGGGAKDKKGGLGDLKVKLTKLKKEKTTIETEIKKVKAQIAKLDTNAAQTQKLVAVDTLRTDTFSHYIEIQGKI